MCHAGRKDMVSINSDTLMSSLHGAFTKVQIYLDKKYGEPTKFIGNARLHQIKINKDVFNQTISFNTVKFRYFDSIKMEKSNVDNILKLYLYRDTEEITEQTAKSMSEADIETTMELLMETHDTLLESSIHTQMLEDIVDRCVRLLK
jgi:hypothetical protein